MEVHHHPKVEKKNFMEYLLEGLMIFLAVLMGFFAESLRENITKKEKETEYIASLARDLEKDKINLAITIDDNRKKVKGLDSLLSLADSDMTIVKNRKLLYRYSSHVSWYSAFISNDATMSQLKNSGGLQFIKRHHIADSIAKYDQEMRGLYAAEGPYNKFTGDATDFMTEMLIFTLKKGDENRGYPLVTNDKSKLQEFFNKIQLERGWSNNYIQNLQERVPYNAKLIELLKKEYDIK
ncbi:hypothetical protein [Mucilaginibacter ginsenosidivorans]|uniref:Uncharacterized protein n=1 Tax=Mucilaginibacter ginsenosidivorans TaxID=398053 RepID=A0A5B8UWQ4_9SPHI|nr:hypothetical protein [Mucilaginibacter ginsenosidivorans]QEC62741.1 hypothetical protein FRZ54_09125 [Mucilaginibacter ginsenosidivorans]